MQKKNKKETFLSHAYSHEEFALPIKITGGVLSQWGPDVHFSYAKRVISSLHLITAGNARYRQESREGHLEPYDIFLSHKGIGQWFGTGDKRFLHKRTLHFDGGALNSLLTTTGLHEYDCIHPRSPGKMICLFRRACHLLSRKPSGFTEELSRAAYDILLECAKSIAPTYPAEINRAVEYIKQNIKKKISLEEIANAAQTSIRHCNRLFNTYLHCSPLQFYHTQKMAVAESMLLNATLSIKQIAVWLGYKDPLYFSSQFKKHFGVSPLQYRQVELGMIQEPKLPY
jgi:AraC-like DNA-binding protein